MGSGSFIPSSGSNICKGENREFKKLNKRASVVGVKAVTEYEAGRAGRDQSCRALLITLRSL